MRVLFIILLLSLGAILLTLVAMWWRLHWHLRRSDHALKNALAEIHRERESIDKT